ncbi:STAS-like domain-containing protein [Paenibacillus glucanolyticus]|uniref:STAS-like domain-containing protein n=1 Tax=Paenibacillus glucanolyticus TaxID=59843 RepID=UPI0035D5FE66
MGRLLKIKDHVNQCYSNADGDIIRREIISGFNRGDKIIVSFKELDSASSSFINTAFIELLDQYDFDFIKQNLGFADASRTINETIKRRFAFEVSNKKKLIEA